MLRSIFEIIGPVMVGPSSSHTAGMAKIGAEAARHLPKDPEKIRLTFSRRMEKTYTGHRSDTACVGGAIGLAPDSPHLKQAYDLAKGKGIRVSVDFFEEGQVPQNTVRVEFTYPDGSNRSLTGTSVGGGSIKILALDGKNCDLKEYTEYGETLPEAVCLGSLAELKKDPRSFAEIAIGYEMQRSGRSREAIIGRMQQELSVMKEAVEAGLNGNRMLYGLTSGNDGKRLMDSRYFVPSGGVQAEAAAFAIAVMEHNASMGRIVAAPTAGSGGILPGVLLSIAAKHNLSDRELVDALFSAAVFGIVMDERGISFSGSIGGCQGEIGVSAAMAAAAEASLFTEDKDVICQAMALTLKNVLGLVCDPVAGPIEVPCIKRNAMGTSVAMMMCDMALCGIKSYIPADEVIDALLDVEKRLPAELKCAAIGGLACTETACRLREHLCQKN